MQKQAKIKPEIYLAFYLVGIVFALFGYAQSAAEVSCLNIHPLGLIHNAALLFYIYTLLSVIKYKYEFMVIGEFFIIVTILLSIAGSLFSFYNIIKIFFNEDCKRLALIQISENTNLSDALIMLIFVEFIIFMTCLLLLTRIKTSLSLTKNPRPVP
ncbi:MAG: hypothetical protein LBE80_05995 [Deltaproteobacteria bacterium]|nr:hypothetical protein [Deltaproteobacteria bacterium]